jgi:hypothetical protein
LASNVTISIGAARTWRRRGGRRVGERVGRRCGSG